VSRVPHVFVDFLFVDLFAGSNIIESQVDKKKIRMSGRKHSSFSEARFVLVEPMQSSWWLDVNSGREVQFIGDDQAQEVEFASIDVTSL
jgi:hypothetical protein